MKAYKIPALIIMALLAFSCSDWLDVPPKTEVDSDRMFESERGFKDAIIGCYVLMGDRSLYGREMTSGFLDVIGQQFTVGTSASEYYYIREFDYTATRGGAKIGPIWKNMYNVIANANNILGNIDKKKDALHPTHYNIIKGEALGLRGFLHFELLRMFGWGNVAGASGNQDKKAIPYSFSYSKVYPIQYTGREVLEFVLADLEAAAALLENYDPWSTTNKAEGYSLPNEDDFYTNRMTRFNYWAVQATLARVYMWMGQQDKALPILEDFIRNQPAISNLAWIQQDNINNTDEKERDLSFSTEHIFRLDVHKLFDNLKDIIDPDYVLPEENVRMLYHTSDYAGELYETTSGGTSDVRYTRLYTKKSSNYGLRKFFDFEGYKHPNNMPLIRMTEMYYMAAECLNGQGKTKDAVELLNTVRYNRGIPQANDLSKDLTKDEVTKEIEKEWKKEFLGEGQMFYFYKRLGYEEIKGAQTIQATNKAYVLPIPEDEINTAGYEPNTVE